jgi:hypothetical protein
MAFDMQQFHGEENNSGVPAFVREDDAVADNIDRG